MSDHGMPARERRALLWLACAAVCWRWLVARRAPMPSTAAVHDYWLAERLAGGDFAAIAEHWSGALHAILLAPCAALGAPLFLSAQVIGCVLGGLCVAPVAVAAERLREGAGVPAGVVVMAAAVPTLACGSGDAAGLLALLAACALWACAAGRRVVAAALAFVVTVSWGAPPALGEHAWPTDVRLLGVGLLCLPLLLLPPRSRAFAAPLAWLLLAAIAAPVGGFWPWAMPFWWPASAVLAGVGLARVPARLRDLCLCGVVASGLHAGWTLGERAHAVAERLVSQYLARRELAAGERVGSPLPRVRWFAGQEPQGDAGADALAIAARPDTGALVLPARSVDASTGAVLAARFAQAELPFELAELAAEHGLVVLRRRP